MVREQIECTFGSDNDFAKPIDSLEMLVDKEVWPMPSYGDLMFEI